jgi:hypothetical protein
MWLVFFLKVCFCFFLSVDTKIVAVCRRVTTTVNSMTSIITRLIKQQFYDKHEAPSKGWMNIINDVLQTAKTTIKAFLYGKHLVWGLFWLSLC